MEQWIKREKKDKQEEKRKGEERKGEVGEMI